MDLDELTSLLDLGIWDQLTPLTCEEIAHNIVEYLPSSFQFLRVETYASGKQSHHIALFEYDTSSEQSTFALISGGKATLGYNPTNHSFVPPEALMKKWQEDGGYFYSGDFYGSTSINYDMLHEYLTQKSVPSMVISNYNVLYAHLENVMLPLREVTIQPFLLEVEAKTHSREPLLHSVITSKLAKQGFRFASLDEWEYACDAGSHTFFHWGNDIPENMTSLMLPTRPNGFGLFIANNPYNWEFCADPRFMRGGDGGYAACGGSGILAEFLPLASAYVHQLSEEEITKGVYGVHIRRAYSFLE